MNKNDGGPAFPRPGDFNPQIGMSLRDYFATKAMQSILAYYDLPEVFRKDELEHPRNILSILVKDAYIVADAMLKAREEK